MTCLVAASVLSYHWEPVPLETILDMKGGGVNLRVKRKDARLSRVLWNVIRLNFSFKDILTARYNLSSLCLACLLMSVDVRPASQACRFHGVGYFGWRRRQRRRGCPHVHCCLCVMVLLNSTCDPFSFK